MSEHLPEHDPDEEQFMGEPLGGRLAREEPEEQPMFGTDEPDGIEEDVTALEDEEPAPLTGDGAELGPDGGGYSAGEAAMRVESE